MIITLLLIVTLVVMLRLRLTLWLTFVVAVRSITRMLRLPAVTVPVGF